MYVAVKGGEKAIDNAHRLLAEKRRGDTSVAQLSVDQIREQLALAVARVMSEGSLYDPDLAARAIRQARGDLIEAIFLVRAYRTTMARFGYTRPLETGDMRIERRVSATYKDIPGGQILGPTFDYTHRLLDFDDEPPEPAVRSDVTAEPAMRVTDILDGEGLVEKNSAAEPEAEVSDLTRAPLAIPAERDLRLQALARADEGFLLSLGYSTQRGFGRTHPFAGEIRYGEIELFLDVPDIEFPVPLGAIAMTECQMVNQFKGSSKQPPQFTLGYGLVFGQSERKAMSMALVDRALRAAEFEENAGAPAQDQEFVLLHCDNVQATGFVEHLKLPHYVDFQAELALVRQMRREHAAANADDAEFKEAAE